MVSFARLVQQAGEPTSQLSRPGPIKAETLQGRRLGFEFVIEFMELDIIT